MASPLAQARTPGQLAVFFRGSSGRFAAGDFRKALGQVREGVAADIREGFERSVSPAGTPWRPLKRRRGRPLVDTGALMAAAVQSAAGGQVSRDGLVLNFSGPGYGAVHQAGTGRIPARPWWGLRPARVEEAARLAAKAGADALLGRKMTG